MSGKDIRDPKTGRFLPGYRPTPTTDAGKARKLLKEMIGGLLLNEFDRFEETFQKLATTSPKAYCEIYVGLLAYRLPKVSAVTVDDDTPANPAVALLKDLAVYN